MTGPLSRRQLLTGVGLAGLAAVLQQDARAATGPHFPEKAKRFVHLFMNGGPSHIDTFDPKPLLDKFHGKPLPGPNLRTERKTAGAMRSPSPSSPTASPACKSPTFSPAPPRATPMTCASSAPPLPTCPITSRRCCS